MNLNTFYKIFYLENNICRSGYIHQIKNFDIHFDNNILILRKTFVFNQSNG